MFIWVRGTLPRLRLDQLMGFAWKFMLPMALINIVAAGVWRFMPAGAARWIVCSILVAAPYLVLGTAAGGPEATVANEPTDMRIDLFNSMPWPFAIIAVLTLASAVAAMSLRNLVHCALALTVTFAGLAALYLQLDAQFVGFAQILVYVGAVAILIVFAILLTRSGEPPRQSVFSAAWVVGVGYSGRCIWRC